METPFPKDKERDFLESIAVGDLVFRKARPYSTWADVLRGGVAVGRIALPEIHGVGRDRQFRERVVAYLKARKKG